MNNHEHPKPKHRRPEHEGSAPRPGIYVARPGSQIGYWYEATGSEEAVIARIDGGKILDTIDFGGFGLQPDEDPAVVANVANGIREHGYAFAVWAKLHDADHVMLAAFTDHYIGSYASMEAVGREMYPDALAGVPDDILPYAQIDYAAFATDIAEALGLLTLYAPDGGIYLFKGPDTQTSEPDDSG